jgi:hypothetical protein
LKTKFIKNDYNKKEESLKKKRDFPASAGKERI